MVAEQNIKPATSPSPVGAAQPRRFLVFAIVSLALMMASVDQTIVATALPTLQRDLHTQVNWSTWTITIYALGQILMMPLAGKLGDQYGRKRVFLTAVVVFTAASLSCGLAGNIYLLIALRFIQALGGGRSCRPRPGSWPRCSADRDRALGLFSSIFPIGGIIGPVLGGVFVTYWTWRGIFLVNVPAGLLLLVLGALFIPASVRRADQTLDIRGVLLLGATLLSAMLGIAYLGSAQSGRGSRSPAPPRPRPSSWSPSWSPSAPWSPSSGTRPGRRAPFIPLRFLAGKGFGVMNLLNFLFGSSALGFAALVPLYAHDRYGLRSLEAGTLLTARAVGMIAIAGLAVFMLRRTGYRWPMVAGFGLTAAGLIAMAVAPPVLSPVRVAGAGRGGRAASGWACAPRPPTTPPCSSRPSRPRPWPGCGACSGSRGPSPRCRSRPRSWPAARTPAWPRPTCSRCSPRS